MKFAKNFLNLFLVRILLTSRSSVCSSEPNASLKYTGRSSKPDIFTKFSSTDRLFAACFFPGMIKFGGKTPPSLHVIG